MKAKPFFSIVIIWFLFLGGMLHAQEEENREAMGGGGQSPSKDDSYMAGKEHYLPDSPYYMAGKRHYLEGKISPEKGENGQREEKTSIAKDARTAGQAKTADDQRNIQIQIEVNVIPEDTSGRNGIIYLPAIVPERRKGPVTPAPHPGPNPPHMGNFHPDAREGFHRDLTIFR